MRLLNNSIRLFRIPFIAHILFRSIVVPWYILEDSFGFAVVFSFLHMFILMTHLKPRNACMLFLAYIILIILLIIQLIDFTFNKKSSSEYYSIAISTEIQGIFPYNITMNHVMLCDACALILSLMVLFLHMKQLEHEEFVASLSTEKTKKRGPFCFTNTLTEDGDGYFENIYGELHINSSRRI